MSVFDSKEFLRLKREWYERLQAAGFEDIESFDGQLKTYSQTRADSQSLLNLNAKLDYYSRAKDILRTYPFRTMLDQAVWFYFSEGNGCRRISQIFARSQISLNKDRIQKILKRLREETGFEKK